MSTFKSLENLDMDPDDFINYMLKYKIPSKKIRKLELNYDKYQVCIIFFFKIYNYHSNLKQKKLKKKNFYFV